MLRHSISALLYRNKRLAFPDEKVAISKPMIGEIRMAAKKSSGRRLGGAKGKSRGARKALDQRLVKALAHELRVEILAILTERVASPNELSKTLKEGLSQVSYHVKVLKEYGCIELVKTEPRRGAVEHYYRATSRTLLPAKGWRKLEEKLRTPIGGGEASQLFDELADALDGKKLAEVDCHISRGLLMLDRKGRSNVKAKVERLAKEVEDEHRASVKRVKESEEGGDDVKGYTVGILAFEKSWIGVEEAHPPDKASSFASANGKKSTGSKKARNRQNKARKR